MKVWVSKHPYCCRTPTPVIETPMVDHQHGDRDDTPLGVGVKLSCVYGGEVGAATHRSFFQFLLRRRRPDYPNHDHFQF